jgi:hypothetical protein
VASGKQADFYFLFMDVLYNWFINIELVVNSIKFMLEWSLFTTWIFYIGLIIVNFCLEF